MDISIRGWVPKALNYYVLLHPKALSPKLPLAILPLAEHDNLQHDHGNHEALPLPLLPDTDDENAQTKEEHDKKKSWTAQQQHMGGSNTLAAGILSEPN
jgi:hypothetical protein